MKSASLQLCNLLSRGMSMKEAKAQLAEKAPAKGKDAKPPKVTPTEKKAALAAEIEALGGEAPKANASVAKFEEALTAAKAKKEQDEADEAQADADEAQKKADDEQAEADAAKDLM